MTMTNDLKELLSFYDDARTIGVEYHYPDLALLKHESYEFYMKSIDNQYVKGIYKSYEYNVFEELENNRKILNDVRLQMNKNNYKIMGIDLKKDINFMTTLKGLKSEFLVKSVETSFDDWALIAERNHVDIQDELLLKNKTIEKLKKITKFDDIYNELKGLYDSIVNLNSMNKSNNKMTKEYEDFYNLTHEKLNNCSFLEHPLSMKEIVRNKIYESFLIEVLNEIRPVIDGIEKKIRVKNPDLILSKAENFLRQSNSSSINQFLLEKIEISNRDFVVDINLDDVDIKKIVRFRDDNSMIAKDKENNVIVINKIAIKDKMIEDIFDSILRVELKNYPKVLPLFVNKLKEDYSLINEALTAANVYIDNVKVLKSKDYNLSGNIRKLSFVELAKSMNDFKTEHKKVFGFLKL